MRSRHLPPTSSIAIAAAMVMAALVLRSPPVSACVACPEILVIPGGFNRNYVEAIDIAADAVAFRLNTTDLAFARSVPSLVRRPLPGVTV